IRIRKEGVEEFLEADTVIIATGNVKDDALTHQWKSLVQEFFIIGDCREPGDALRAIREGFEIGATI
ncbi:MAG: hypothetical protein DRG59_11260, partial [Deltaproteobacteria bacterium]